MLFNYKLLFIYYYLLHALLYNDILEFIYEPSTSINYSQESALLALSNDLNTINANYPEIDFFSSFSSHITQLLTSMDHINLKYTRLNEELNSFRADVESLKINFNSRTD